MAQLQANDVHIKAEWEDPSHVEKMARASGTPVKTTKAAARDGPGSPADAQISRGVSESRNRKYYSQYKQYELLNGALSAEELARHRSSFENPAPGSSVSDEQVSHHGVFQSEDNNDADGEQEE